MVAVLAEHWLRGRFMVVTVVFSLGAMVSALSAQRAVWAVMGAVAIAGAATAFFGPLLRPWRPSRTWLIMLTHVGVRPRCDPRPSPTLSRLWMCRGRFVPMVTIG